MNVCLISVSYIKLRGFPGGSVVKNLPAMQEMKFQSLGREDPLEEEVATHSSIFAWRIDRVASIGGKESNMTRVTEHSHTY